MSSGPLAMVLTVTSMKAPKPWAWQFACESCAIGNMRADKWLANPGLYTDESPGLKVDPVVVLVLSLGFIFSVVALHSMYPTALIPFDTDNSSSLDGRGANARTTVIAKISRRFSS